MENAQTKLNVSTPRISKEKRIKEAKKRGSFLFFVFFLMKRMRIGRNLVRREIRIFWGFFQNTKPFVCFFRFRLPGTDAGA